MHSRMHSPPWFKSHTKIQVNSINASAPYPRSTLQRRDIMKTKELLVRDKVVVNVKIKI